MNFLRDLLPCLFVGLAACGGDETSTVPQKPVPSVERGQYMAERLGPCGQCHTPKDAMGAPDDTRHFGGNDCFIDIDPMDDMIGCLAAPNITNHPTGLANRTDAEIRAMITTGIRPDGSVMFPMMPYFVIHTFTDVDIDSIVLYLRSVPGVDRVTAKSQPPFNMPPPSAPPPLSEAEMPMPTTKTDAAMRGRYLVVGACITCHTPLVDPTDFRKLDTSKLFAGGYAFSTPVLGLPSPPFPAVIYSSNLTPEPSTGLGYSKEQLTALLKSGNDKGGKPVCPPMPIKGAYQGLSDSDISDMADYILALPPVMNAVPGTCEGM